MKEQERIIRYWHSVELLQPQAVPKIKKRLDLYSAFFHDTTVQQPIVPWAPESIVGKQDLPKGYSWDHTVFGYLYDSRFIAEKLSDVFGSEHGYRQAQPRESALFSLKFSHSGEMNTDSFVLSSEAWFIGRLIRGSDWRSGFEDDQKFARNHAESYFAGQVAGETLRDFTDWLLRFLGVFDFFHAHVTRPCFRFRSQPTMNSSANTKEEPILNSFFLSDLAYVADNIRNGLVSSPLNQYLSQHAPHQRLHVDNNEESTQLIEQLLPDQYPNGCWPSEKHLGLVHSQQLALNKIFSTLSNSEGLLGINGPPGTGKTTLLRDLIAGIVTKRADELALFRRASDGFISDGREKANDNGASQACFKLNPALFGHEIVVASSNNGAVENITRELPQRDKIDPSWLPLAEYFSEFGENVIGEPAWALISGALGSKTRRNNFIENYFYKRRNSPAEKVKQAVSVEADARIKQKNISQIAPSPDQDPGSEGGPSNLDCPGGLFDWLNAHIDRNRSLSPIQRQEIWQQAVAQYEEAKAKEVAARRNSKRILTLIRSITQNRKEISDSSAKLCALEKALADTSAQLAHLDATDCRSAQLLLRERLDAIKQHQAKRPTFWANLLNLWRPHLVWRRANVILEQERELAAAEFDRISRLVRNLEVARSNIELGITEGRCHILQLQSRNGELGEEIAKLINGYEAKHLLAWLRGESISNNEEIELAEPWIVEGWRTARAQVFIQALKLHRSFIQLEAARICSNLVMANRLLSGQQFGGLSREAIRSAWASLFMVVPVLSSTFASFDRCFGSLQVGEIGWLLVDEAGQATPQSAVGALCRARRAVMVGDPLQLKPITNVSDAVLEHMRTLYQVDMHWLPNRQSAQTLADEATPWGRLAGPRGSKSWVGLPLIVHRRCDRPMFELANRIAYDGTMVYGTVKPRPENDTPASVATGWIHVNGISQGNWVPAEGEALSRLLEQLKNDGVLYKDISIVTPFSDVRRHITDLIGNKIACGTIHIMQGKEASVVIMVLGGNTASPGARSWVVSEPNFINVAATRAKRRFYVIGDKNYWKDLAIFRDITDLLPIRRVNNSEPVLAA